MQVCLRVNQCGKCGMEEKVTESWPASPKAQ